MVKKFFVPLLVTLTVFFMSFFTMPTSVHADSAFTGDCRYFLGLTSWDCGVDISDQDSLKSGIWTIVANVLTDVTVIAAYLVLGYVIYGGYLYTMSGGDPNKVATGKKTLSQAFIGLGIVLLANIIMNTIRIALGASFTENCATTQCVDPTAMVTSAIQWVIAVVGIVSAIFVVYGGISYITSAGDPGKAQKAKSMILYALIGLAIVALAEIITAFVTGTINQAKSGDTSLTNEIIISKEVNEISIN